MLTGLLPVLLAGSEPTGSTPALGWNSWNFYRDKLDETVVKDTTDAMIATGLAKKGYTVREAEPSRCLPSARPPHACIQRSGILFCFFR